MLSPQFDIYEQVSKIVYGRVADIGSGTGFGTHLFARNSDEVYGYEVDTTARDFAQKAFSNGKIQFYKADIVKNRIEYSDFDFITMIDVIEHIKEDYQAIKNCSKLLKKDGKFICSTPNRLSRYRKGSLHVREYSPQELKDVLELVFRHVTLLNYELEPIQSEYENPIIGLCL
jgi:2-polyprenyl-3-methyl-5-hydroxy-6-metoxy-1,4-benzoquinol methylase